MLMLIPYQKFVYGDNTDIASKLIEHNPIHHHLSTAKVNKVNRTHKKSFNIVVSKVAFDLRRFNDKEHDEEQNVVNKNLLRTNIKNFLIPFNKSSAIFDIEQIEKLEKNTRLLVLLSTIRMLFEQIAERTTVAHKSKNIPRFYKVKNKIVSK